MNDWNTGNGRRTRRARPRLQGYATLCLASALTCAGTMACSDEEDSVDIRTLNPADEGSGGTRAGDGDTSAGGGDTSAGGTSSDAEVAATRALVNAALQLDDDEIVLVADAINAGKVAQASAVLPRLSNEDVRAFAERMIDEHSAAREELSLLAEQQGLEPDDSDLSDSLERDNATTIARLERTPDESLDVEYIETQERAHGVARMIGGAMIAAADNDALRNQVTTLSGDIEAHRAEAARIAHRLASE